MILSKGNNRFSNNKYSYWEWSAPILQTYEELLSKFKELKLEGRIIKDIRCVGMAYNWRDDDIVDCAYNILDEMTDEQRKCLKNSKLMTMQLSHLLLKKKQKALKSFVDQT